MENIETKLREEAQRLLLEKKADVIVGYEQGTLPLTATPCFITKPEEAEKLVWNNLCTQNLAKFVHDLITAHKNSQKRVKPEDRKKKVVGVIARGCTTRSLIIHLQEKQYDRGEVYIIGVPCDGYVEGKKLKSAIGGAEIIEGSIDGGQIKVKTQEGEKSVALKDVLSDSCRTCRFNNPIISDVMVGSPAAAMNPEKMYSLQCLSAGLPIMLLPHVLCRAEPAAVGRNWRRRDGHSGIPIYASVSHGGALC